MSDQRRVSDVQGYEGHHEVHQGADDGAAHGGFFVLGTGHALKHILLRDGTKGKRKESPGHGPPGGGIHVGGEHVEFAIGCGLCHHFVKSARIAAHQQSHRNQAHHDDHSLKQIGESHRPHAAKHGVEQHHGRAHHDGVVQVNRPGREHMDDQAQRRQLRRGPAQVRQHNRHARQHLDRLAVAHLVEVSDGQQVQAVKQLGEQQSRQYQADGGPKRVTGNAVQAVFGKGGRHRQDGLSPEPGSEYRGHVHVKRQTAPCHQVILGPVHATSRQQADADGHGQISDYKSQQHL